MPTVRDLGLPCCWARGGSQCDFQDRWGILMSLFPKYRQYLILRKVSPPEPP